MAREIHAEAIAQFGGSDGIRDEALLDSAVGAPQASFGGRSPFSDLAEVAAAYLYYLCKNHPFVDGNKRVGAVAALVFLEMNSIKIEVEDETLVKIVLAVAGGKLQKSALAEFLRGHARA